MTHLFVCAEIEAPPPPVELEELALNQIKDLNQRKVVDLLKYNTFRLPAYMDSRGSEYTDRIVNHPTGSSISAFTNTIFLNHAMTEWAKDNVIATAKDMRYTFTVPGRPRLGPHVDLTRNYTVIYLLQNGGVNPTTVFYKEKNCEDIIRPNGHHVNDYNNLISLISIVIPLNCWIIINSRILHSVENINDGRTSYQISLDQMPDSYNFKRPVFLHV